MVTCPMCGEDAFPEASECGACGEPLRGGGWRRSPRGIYRKGKSIVMEVDALLPDRCIKSNVFAKRRLKRELSWHPSWVVLLIFCGGIPFIIAAMLSRKRATVHVPLSDESLGKRRNAILTGWGMAVVAVGLCIAGNSRLGQGDIGTYLVVAAVLLGLIGAIYGLTSASVVSAKRITATHVWLTGVCAEFLDELPEWNE